MSRRSRYRRQKGAQLTSARSPGRLSWHVVLVAHQRRHAKRYAGLVQAARRPALANRTLPEILGTQTQRQPRQISFPHSPIALFPAVARRSTRDPDRKSTRLNSSHLVISYAVF